MPHEFDLAAYLARIGHTAPVQPDLDTLSALHLAHVRSIPFESIDPLLGRPVSIDLPAIQAKLIHGQRGGYCFEQNGLFKAALEAIGFTVTGLTGRVRWMSEPGSPLGARTHMLLKIDLKQGAFLADVGFGACLLDQPLRFETDIEQKTGMGAFRLTQAEGVFTLSASQPGSYRTMYVFDLVPQIQADYEAGSWYAATNPSHPFVHVLIMERLAEHRRYKLLNRRLVTEAHAGEILSEHEIASPLELETVLRDTFLITPPVPAADLFARISGQM